MKKRNESGWYRVSKAFLEFQGAFYFGRRIRQRKEETNMKELTGNQVRQMFLDYFQSKGHMIEPGASLIPHNDPTLLWINAGVAALKKYFDGSEKPAVDFKNAVIIMTSNAGARALLDSKPLGFATGEKKVNDGRKSAVLEEVKRIFRPEFLNRIDEILVFDPLGEAELRQIVEQMLKELSGRLQENGLDIKVTDEAKAELLKAGKDTRYGARPLRRALRKLVEDPVSDLYLASELNFIN